MTSPEYLEVPKRRAMSGEDGTVPRKDPFRNVAKMLYEAHNPSGKDMMSPTEKAMKGMPPPDQVMNGMEDTSQITRGMDDLEMVIKGMDLTVGPMGRLLKLHTERGKREEERERRRRAERRRRREREREREKEREGEEDGGNEQKQRDEAGEKTKKKMGFMRRISFKGKDSKGKGEAGECNMIKRRMTFLRRASDKENNDKERSEAGVCKVIKRRMSFMRRTSLKENDKERGGAGEFKGTKKKNFMRSISLKDDILEKNESPEYKVIKGKKKCMRSVSLKEYNTMERCESGECRVIKRKMSIMRGVSLKENNAMDRSEVGECKVIKKKSTTKGVSLRENDTTERGEAGECKVIKEMSFMRSASLNENDVMGRGEIRECKAIKRKVSSLREPSVRETVRGRGETGEWKPTKRNMSELRKTSVKGNDIKAYQDCKAGYKQILKVHEPNKERAYEDKSMYKEKEQVTFKEKEQNTYKDKEANTYKAKEAHVYRETGINVYRPREKNAFTEREHKAYKVVRNVYHEKERKAFLEKEKSTYRGREMNAYKQDNNAFPGKEKNVCQETEMSAYKDNRFKGKCPFGEELVPRRTRNIQQMGRVNEMRRLRGRDCRFGSRAAGAPRTRIRRGRDPSYLSLWRIVLCSVVSSSTLLLPGTVSGFTAVTLPQLTDPASTDMILTPDYASVFVSIINLGVTVGSMVGIVLMVHFGQRKSLLLLLPCILVLWMVIALTTSPLLLIMARGVLGIGIAISQSAGDTFVGETVHCKYRGRLLGVSAVALRSGACFVYILGSTGLTWRQIAAINAILTSVPTFIGLLFLHDSPRWLMRKRRPLDAAQALQFFRGPKYDISEELLEIEDSIKESTSMREQLRRLLDVSILKRLIWFSLFLLFLAYSGSFTILIYTVPIFRIANASNNAYHSTIILSFVRILGGVAYLIAVDQIGRRVSIAVAFVSCGISMATFSVYFYIQDVLQKTEVIASINWLPLVSLMIFVFFLGYGEPACFLLVNEILPNSFRTSGFSIVVVVHYLGGFSVSYVYPPMREEFGTHGAFAFYTLCCIALATFPYVILSETKGRTLEDIDKYYRPRRQTRQELTGV